MMPVASCIPFPFSASCGDILAMLVCATHWLYMHLYTLAYMSMYESYLLVCHPCFNTMKLWTFDPNLHLSLADTTFYSFSCLFAQFPTMLAMFIMLIYFMPFHILFASFLSITCLLVSLLYLCMYTHGARTHGARARFSRRKQKGCGHEHVVKPSGCSQQVQEFSFSLLVMYCFKPLPSSYLSPLDDSYQVYHAMYHSSSSLKYGDPCLLSSTYILGHALGMYAFTFLHCVLALCIMYVYIYLLDPPPFGVIVTVRTT